MCFKRVDISQCKEGVPLKPYFQGQIVVSIFKIREWVISSD